MTGPVTGPVMPIGRRGLLAAGTAAALLTPLRRTAWAGMGAETAVEIEARRIIAEFDGPLAAPRVAAYAEAVLARLAAAAEGGHSFRLTLLDSPAFNAVALPDGQLFLARGMIGLCRDTAELAAVIAHEMGHVIGRHAVQRAARAGIDPDVAAIVGLPADAALFAFTRAQEAEADDIAAALLARAGWDPGALADIVAAVAALTALDGIPVTPDFHPTAEERVARRVAGGGSRDRDAHLDAVDGLRWGEAAGRPGLRGDLAIDLDGPIRWRAPAGWPLMRSRLQTVALGPGGAVVAQDAITQPGNPAADLYLTRLWGARLGVTAAQSTAIGGRPAAVAPVRLQGGRGLWEGVLAVVETTAERRDRFALIAPAGSAMIGAMLPVLDTIGPPSAAERALAAPRHLAITTAAPGDTVAALTARMPPDLADARRLRLVDGLGPAEEPAPGRRVKLIV